MTMLDVSIHAPVRERPYAVYLPIVAGSFNSRSREGATSVRNIALRGMLVSIHAPVRERHIMTVHDDGGKVSIHAPVRERRTSREVFFVRKRFNSRSREGATIIG